MSQFLKMEKNRNWIRLSVAISGLAIVVFVASAVGVMAGSYLNPWRSVGSAGADLPLVLNADTASSGKSLCMATGLIDVDDNVEGLFVLDRLSGNLQCWVMNRQTGGIAAIYFARPAQDMDLDKTGDIDYVMTTGRFNFQRRGRTGNFAPAGCVCYVGDGNSGKVIGYSVQYNRQAAIRGGATSGQMAVVCKGFARDGGLQRDQ